MLEPLIIFFFLRTKFVSLEYFRFELIEFDPFLFGQYLIKTDKFFIRQPTIFYRGRCGFNFRRAYLRLYLESGANEKNAIVLRWICS